MDRNRSVSKQIMDIVQDVDVTDCQKGWKHGGDKNIYKRIEEVNIEHQPKSAGRSGSKGRWAPGRKPCYLA